jgi:hypothetical protein
VSQAQNGHPVHMLLRLAGEGRARTACGAVVEDALATTDCLQVTCRSKGCVAVSTEVFQRRRVARSVAW